VGFFLLHPGRTLAAAGEELIFVDFNQCVGSLLDRRAAGTSREWRFDKGKKIQDSKEILCV